MAKKNGLIDKEQAPIEEPKKDIENEEVPEWVKKAAATKDEKSTEDVSNEQPQEPQAHNPYPGIGTRAYRQ